jgi:hypothetical protein
MRLERIGFVQPSKVKVMPQTAINESQDERSKLPEDVNAIFSFVWRYGQINFHSFVGNDPSIPFDLDRWQQNVH